MYEDELSWGGAWLYMATNDSQYLTDAEQYYQPGAAWGQSWDDKNTGNMASLCYSLRKLLQNNNAFSSNIDTYLYM